MRTPFELSDALRSRLRPVAVLVLVIVWLATPLGWCALRLAELHSVGTKTAGQIAELVQREVNARPVLWRYDTIKLAEHAQGHLAGPDVRAVAIVDALGPALDLGNGDASLALAPPRVVWTRAALALSGGSSGTVWVAMSTERLLRGAMALFVGFGVLALGLAWLIRWIPLGTVILAEQRIQGLLAELQGLNTTLESRIAAAVQELRGNQQRLDEQAAKTATWQEEERRRIARDLHDGLGQTLTGLRLRLQVLQQRPDLPPEANAALGDALSLTDESIDETRHAVQRLAPPLLAELGLVAALRRHCQGFAERTGLQVTCEVQGEVPHASAVEAACYRIAQEALTNVARHAQAETVVVRLDASATRIHLEIADDGRGMPADRSAGHGLVSMRERAEVLGGTFGWHSRSGEGVRVVVELPIGSAA